MEMNFEDKLAELETIVEKLEKGQLSLDESLELFEHGITLSRECNAMLKNARQKVEKLIEEDNNLKSEDFALPDDTIKGHNF
ncbi:MAG: exodeoxyribonuclease VII small subunit [Euryarchaeota archaeon]|nr:exodeoxyribonuclease VII small subunit [Euryarchaeota archaeon]MBU4221081.1 exodeoxyribonuclease VII small subunit [Euryarchaeota archaeon]MBU4339666.1 exodeoxyribonuclease VII small subunit [Euryarchaeota archaeon]MBU4453518.1 exodeoxyribonuclease VII small subunit [Euryarchaeota archaeon]